MPQDVKVPAVGKVDKKWAYAGGAIIVGILGYAYWTRSKNTPATEPINPDAIPQDRVPFTDAQVSSGETNSFTAGHPTTLADWGTAATDRLLELGRDAGLVASALGKYLTRQGLTPSEQDIVRTAIGQLGKPPGEDIPILAAPPPPASTSGGTTGGSYSGVPAKVTNLHVHKRTSKTIELSWNRASGAVAYAVYRNGGRINIMPIPAATVGIIHATYTVKAIGVTGKYGPASNPLAV